MGAPSGERGMEDARMLTPAPRAPRFRSPHRVGGLLLALGLAATVLGACSGSPAASSSSATTAPTSAASQAVPTDAGSPTAAGSGAGLAAVCRHLANLKANDYAFGQSFSNISALAAGSKAQTITDLQAFVQEAPPEVQAAAAGLLAFWTDLAANPSSVNENDPRLAQAAAGLGAWLSANC
jgi:hypothetical protein